MDTERDWMNQSREDRVCETALKEQEVNDKDTANSVHKKWKIDW